MGRETALKQLQDIRREIIDIHSETEICRELQKQAEALHNEKERPIQPNIPLKPENTAAALKQSFEQENRERLRRSKMPKILTVLINAVIQATVAVLLGLDIFGMKGMIIPAETVSLLNAEGNSNGTILFAVHLLPTLATVLITLFWERFSRDMNTKLKIVLGIITMAALYSYIIMCGWVKVFTYLILSVGGLALALAVGGIALLVKKGKIKSSAAPLSAAQKNRLEKALADDERAKAENSRRLADEQRRLDEERKRRMPEIDREIQEKVQRFEEARRQVDLHMKRLDAMDALCDDDKTLQIVDLLIRLIETRRADSVKEALQEYDKLIANRQLLEIEKQKLEAELKRASLEHSDRMQQLNEQRRHQTEMEYLARDSAKSRAEIAGQLDHLGAVIYYNLNA